MSALTPSTTPKPFCFVLMPFDKKFNDVYEYGIKGACADASVYCERVDEQIFLGSMLERIYSQISRANLLIADMTGKNPNVFYEVGYAHALGKNVILLTSVAADIPFDLKHFPHIVYGNEIKTLRDSLTRHLKFLTTESPSPAQTQIAIELYCGKKRLSTHDVCVEFTDNYLPGAELTVFNDSSHTYHSGEFRVAVVAPHPMSLCTGRGIESTALPDGSFMHMLPDTGTLFPSAFTKLEVYLSSGEEDTPEEFQTTVRVFSSAGTRDYPLKFRRRDA